MNLRKIKEAALGAPAELLARLNVSPNVVTLVGLLLDLYAEHVAYTNTSEGDTQEVSTLWLATGARMLSLAADGLDGSVARAHKKLNPSYTNEYGSYIDGGIDRLVNTIRMMVESSLYQREGKRGASILTAVNGVLGNVPSYLRAKTEARGGVTKEQSLNFWEFAGTHAGRTAIYILTSLKHTQVDQIVSFLTGKHISSEAWEAVKLSLLGYVAMNTVVVSGNRARALVATYESDPSTNTDGQPPADSAGNTDKNGADHKARSRLYLTTLVASGVWAGSSISQSLLGKKR
jgi:phosphatidylglycerophosphate synthase